MDLFNIFSFQNQSGSKENQPPEGNSNNQPTTQGPINKPKYNPFIKGRSDTNGRKSFFSVNRDEPIVEGMELFH